MIDIQLCINKSDDIVVDKNLDIIASTSGVLKDQTDIINPSFIMSDVNDYIATSNYIYVETFNRYYYINKIISVAANVWEFECHIDVLMSFKDQIRQQVAIVDRQENITNTMLSDNRIKVQANPRLQQLRFPRGFNTKWSYALVVSGN